jgi:tRNA A-37 threonylcarbamoyl transferase component Bud32
MAIYNMHQCGVGHGDLKGDNVIIHFNPSNQDCDAVLIDFALCEALGPPSNQGPTVELDMSRYDSTWDNASAHKLISQCHASV